MPGSYYLPLAVVTTATAAALLIAACAVTVDAAAECSGRMVIIRAPGARVVVDAGNSGGALISKWQRQRQRQRRLVEDEVAPELGGLLGAGDDDSHISADALKKNRAICLANSQCAAKVPGGSNTRSCTYKEHCNH